MVLFLNGNQIIGINEDNSVKELPDFINDDNCIVVSDDVKLLDYPDDGNEYVNAWDREKQEVYLMCLGAKPTPPTTLEDVKQDTTVINENVETSSSDNLINMDMLLGLDEKLNLILEHLGLIS